MHPADIKAALEKAGKPPSRVARALKLRPSTVSQVIHDKGKSRRVAGYISDAIGIPVSQLWPGSYPALELAEIRGTRRAA
ncbi:hypothetical protein ED208_12550 [Stagnimonas aquatica]|uniref:Ner winged helix-turn-helix DNA-binding domain-containing protein n=1 Tax=Stagnimonas aquatica TaxID=2689987 RepID=A0A3N0V7R3_9GAMM|nr:hypothetical protein ED208_12550 [Stagnimonas aquatica]